MFFLREQVTLDAFERRGCVDVQCLSTSQKSQKIKDANEASCLSLQLFQNEGLTNTLCLLALLFLKTASQRNQHVTIAPLSNM